MTDADSSFLVRFWGVRGSVASGGANFAGVGGNTSCIEVRAGGELIIIDAGTGVFPLGHSLAQPVRATFLFTHFHWDHIQGFPLFRPAYGPENTLTIYGPGETAAEVQAVFDLQMQPPFSPVTLAALPVHVDFLSLQPGDDLWIGDVHISTVSLHHPQLCLGYRISVDGLSLAVATDTEPPAGQPVDPAVLKLAHGTDLLIHDSQYSQHEYDGRDGVSRKGWGHSTYEMACQAAWEAGANQLVLFHHDPLHDDSFIGWMEAGARALFPNALAAREAMTLEIGGSEHHRPGARRQKVVPNDPATLTAVPVPDSNPSAR